MAAAMQSYAPQMPRHSNARETQTHATMVTQAASGAGSAAAAEVQQ
jgi:hypothetical protein